ncbi:unnamed protein product [Ostreobium quekettii]|uniref:Uncharacterized protein n=1 Tax=Ostreobium quekettii TaxID=121088 RepID=A0A8S1J3R1_9CHLO|nr:unnamed protein product [Ostreobium quekettii]
MVRRAMITGTPVRQAVFMYSHLIAQGSRSACRCQSQRWYLSIGFSYCLPCRIAEDCTHTLHLQEYINGQLKAKYGDCFIRGNNGEDSAIQKGRDEMMSECQTAGWQ